MAEIENSQQGKEGKGNGVPLGMERQRVDHESEHPRATSAAEAWISSCASSPLIEPFPVELT